jgi:hypothetical protein
MRAQDNQINVFGFQRQYGTHTSLQKVSTQLTSLACDSNLCNAVVEFDEVLERVGGQDVPGGSEGKERVKTVT